MFTPCRAYVMTSQIQQNMCGLRGYSRTLLKEKGLKQEKDRSQELFDTCARFVGTWESFVQAAFWKFSDWCSCPWREPVSVAVKKRGHFTACDFNWFGDTRLLGVGLQWFPQEGLGRGRGGAVFSLCFLWKCLLQCASLWNKVGRHSVWPECPQNETVL